MKIGLMDVDRYTLKTYRNYPNLPLMKISAFHKARKDAVSEWMGLEHYDIVYQAKVFNNDRDITTPVYADKIIRGGTGYSLENKLPPEIEHIYPDYGLYGIKETAFGFLSRGCPRGCTFCIVANKEGRKSVQVAELDEFWHGEKNIILYDPNILACQNRNSLLEQIYNTGANVEFNQGLDIRLMDNDCITLLEKIKLKNIYFAWDNPNDFKIENNFIFYSNNSQNKFNGFYATVYVLCNYDSTLEQDLYRVYRLRDLGYDPYVMLYDKENADKKHLELQRWCNSKWIFRTVKYFDEYHRTIKQENKQQLELFSVS